MPVNRKLQKIFGQLDYVEQTGHGVLTIIKKYGKDVFDFKSNNFLNVTIPFTKLEEISDNVERDNSQSASEEIVNFLKSVGDATTKEIADNINRNEIYIRRLLGQMSKDGVVEHIGSNKTGYWILKSKN